MERQAPILPRLLIGAAVPIIAASAVALGFGTDRTGGRSEPIVSEAHAPLVWGILLGALALAVLSAAWLRAKTPIEQPWGVSLRSAPTMAGLSLGMLGLVVALAAIPGVSLGQGTSTEGTHCVGSTDEKPLASFEVTTALAQDGLPMLSPTSGRSTFTAPNTTMIVRLGGPDDVSYVLEVRNGTWQSVPGNAADGYGIQDMGGMELRVTVTGPADADGRDVETTVRPATLVTEQHCT